MANFIVLILIIKHFKLRHKLFQLLIFKIYKLLQVNLILHHYCNKFIKIQIHPVYLRLKLLIFKKILLIY